MSEDFSRGKMLIVVFVWLVVFGIGASLYKFWWAPIKEKKEKQEQESTITQTSSGDRYKYVVNFGIDDFSGYALFRSDSFKDELSKLDIGLNLVEDSANYAARFKKLADGQLDMAVFTLDSLIKNSFLANDMPAVAIAVVDETKGADAIVGAKSIFPNLDSLDDNNVKVVYTEDSPSETLFRIIAYTFKLDNLKRTLPVKSIDEVYDEYQKSKVSDKKIFVLWEPYISKVTANPDYKILLDSSKFSGYIVDVIVARRGFLLKNQKECESFVKAYFSCVFNTKSSIVDLVVDDSLKVGQPISIEQSKTLTNRIVWKNTQENFAHFGVLGRQHNMQHIGDMASNIIKILLSTRAISKDITDGKVNKLYYDGILRKMHDEGWHPGLNEKINETKSVAELKKEDWNNLRVVGSLRVQKLVFARGTAKLSSLSNSILDNLAETLKSFPSYYIVIRSGVSKIGNAESNKSLTKGRLQSVIDYLASKSIDKNRMKAELLETEDTSVRFFVGELPY